MCTLGERLDAHEIVAGRQEGLDRWCSSLSGMVFFASAGHSAEDAVLPVPQNALSRNHLKEPLTWQREVGRYGQRFVPMEVGALVLEATNLCVTSVNK